MEDKPLVKCFLSSSDGIARWALEIGDRRSSMSSLEMDIQVEGLVESISVVFRALLQRERISPSDIDQVVFILGPGSFTSLRTSYSFLRGLIAPNKIKLVGISTFLAFLLSNKIRSVGEVKLCLKANAQENFVSEFFIKSDTSLDALTPKALSFEACEGLNCEGVQEIVDTDMLIDASHLLAKLDEESILSLVKAGHLSMNSEHCELLYIKGVSAKTLLERGVV